MKTVLVTGAGGFIGSHLVEDQLQRNRLVKAFDLNLDRLSHLAGNDRCQLITGDLRSEALLRKIVPGTDCIFHLASAHLEVSKPEAYYWETNVEALRRFLHIAHANGIKRFVHCSSVGVYGKLQQLPANEETPCHPDILYERTKLGGEQVVRQCFHGLGLPVVILRPAWVYGPRCQRTLKLFRTIKKKRFLMVGGGNNYRHPVYITDMLQAFESAAQKDNLAGETFIIASERAVQLKELINEIARVQGVRLPGINIPLPIMQLICLVVEKLFMGKEPPFSRRSLKFFTDSAAFRINKAMAKLDFKPQVDLRQGLAETSRWIQGQELMPAGGKHLPDTAAAALSTCSRPDA